MNYQVFATRLASTGGEASTTVFAHVRDTTNKKNRKEKLEVFSEMELGHDKNHD